MVGIGEHIAVIGDWVPPPNPSPRIFFSSILGDDFGSQSFSDLLGDNGGEGPSMGSSENLEVPTLKEEDGTGIGVSDDHLSDSSNLSCLKSCPRRGLAERMAARAGFNAPRLNTARIRSANLSSPEVLSPYLMIPPGLSPTTLLDSPVFLSNSLAQPSPTTGKFSFAPIVSTKRSISVPEAPDRDKDDMFEDVDASSFAFKPHMESSSSFFLCAVNQETPARSPPQSLPSIEVSVQPECNLQSQSIEATEDCSKNKNNFHPWKDFPKSSDERDINGNIVTSEPRVSNAVIANAGHYPAADDQQDGEDQRNYGELTSTVISGATSEDGYNWRKYGQKQVKGSECPRSYYKCTHPNCQVKKKVERSHEGHITEIIYKGAHFHPKPPPNRRSAVGFSNLQNDMHHDIPEHAEAQAMVDGDPVWISSQGGPDLKHDNLEATSSASVAPEFCDPSTSMQAPKAPHFESIAVDASPSISNDEDEDDRGTHGSVSLSYDGEGYESDSKRRKIDVMDIGGAARAIREPRVVVQTTSEVDILDDGYRWRKYGQKVVKGNPNPRSYYKCTNAGCTVRKHVERASHDLKSVITTYEGKHNHDVPAARHGSHSGSGPSSTVPINAPQSFIHRPEPSQSHDNMTRFNGRVSLGALGLSERQYLGSSPGLSFGMNQPGLTNLVMTGVASGQAKSIHQYLGQQHQVNEVGFMTKKGEPKNESVSEVCLNLSNGLSVYHQVIGRLPLGP